MNGCHELLASLGFDLAEVGQDEVTLRTGKTANRRHIQFVLQSLLALFGNCALTLIKLIFCSNITLNKTKLTVSSFFVDTQEAPRSLSLESSSSIESLASIDDGDLEQHSDGEPPPRQHRRKLLLDLLFLIYTILNTIYTFFILQYLY